MFMSSIHKWSNHIQDESDSRAKNKYSDVTKENRHARSNTRLLPFALVKRARAEIGDEFISFDT